MQPHAPHSRFAPGVFVWLRCPESVEARATYPCGDLNTDIGCDLSLPLRLMNAAHTPAPSKRCACIVSGVSSPLRHTVNIHPRRPSVFDRHIERLAAVKQQDPQRAMALSRTLINEP